MKRIVATEDPRCNNCSARSNELLATISDDTWQPADDDKFRIVRCQNCALVYMSPRPKELELERILSDTKLDPFEAWLKLSRQAEEREFHPSVTPDLERVLSYAKGPDLRILHVECGEGFTLSCFQAARTHTLETFGTSTSPELAFHARKRGHKIHDGTLESLELPPSSFDFVWTSYCLGNRYDATRFASEVFRILKPAGIFWVRTDNFDHVDVKLAGPSWEGYDGPRRWFYYQPETIDYLARKVGFELASVNFPRSRWHHLRHHKRRQRLLDSAAEQGMLPELMRWAQFSMDCLLMAFSRPTSTMDAVLHKPDIPQRPLE